MRRTLSFVFMAMAILCFAMPVFAQGTWGAAGPNWVAIASGFAMAIASGRLRLGPGQGNCRRRRRVGAQSGRPSGIQLALILGLALIESLALYTLVIIFAKVK